MILRIFFILALFVSCHTYDKAVGLSPESPQWSDIQRLRLPLAFPLPLVRTEAMDGGVYALGAGGMLCVPYMAFDWYANHDRLIYYEALAVACGSIYEQHLSPKSFSIVKRKTEPGHMRDECGLYLAAIPRVFAKRFGLWLKSYIKTVFHVLNKFSRKGEVDKDFLSMGLFLLDMKLRLLIRAYRIRITHPELVPVDRSSILKFADDFTSRLIDRMLIDQEIWDTDMGLTAHEVLNRTMYKYGYIPPFDPRSPDLQGFADDYMLELFRIHYRDSARLGFRRSVPGLFGPKKRVITGIPPAVQSQMKRILGVDFHGLWRYLQTEWGLEVENG